MNTTIAQRNAADAAILRELAAKTLGDSTFALNTNDLPGAAIRLRDALGYVERLIQATGTPSAQPNGFNGYLMNAINAHQARGGEFTGYDMNNPSGKAPAGKTAPITGNAGQAGGEFAGYDLNAINEAA
jgi:hypothetical protein